MHQAAKVGVKGSNNGSCTCMMMGLVASTMTPPGAAETIFTTCFAFVVTAVAVIFHNVVAIECQKNSGQALGVLLDLLPDWIRFVIGLHDLLGAYRQCPNVPCQAHWNIVEFLHSKLKRWMRMIQKGHVFGKMAAVLNLCRLPCLTRW